MTTNPSHILMARNSRSQNNSSLSPTETHAAAAGIIRSQPQSSYSSVSRSTPVNSGWVLEECSSDEEDSRGGLDGGDLDWNGREIELDETFTRNARFVGTVKIVVENTTFWAHREILVFASPFFEAALSGQWAETNAGGRPQSISSVITIPQQPAVPTGIHGNTLSSHPLNNSSNTEMTFAPLDSCGSGSPPSTDSPISMNDKEMLLSSGSGSEEDLEDARSEFDDLGVADDTEVFEGRGINGAKTGDEKRIKHKRALSLEKLLGGKTMKSDKNGILGEFTQPSLSLKGDNAFTPLSPKEKGKMSAHAVATNVASAPNTAKHEKSFTGSESSSSSRRKVDAVVVLKEERASIFHDFLKFVYPHLVCTITWNNVEGLMNISNKLCVPSLQQQCLAFLLSHAAGKPLKAMRIAELFEEEDLYRESSRFVLDNPGGWSEDELGTLSQITLLKLEKRRNWFLERVLKLGLINVAKEYQCCPSCPDPANCARILDDKWRQAYNACFRFGPCQPSMVYRYLRSLEGVSPPLSLTHLNCQVTAKAFAATLFDRMFALGVRGSDTNTTAFGAKVAGAASGGPRKQFLYCSLKSETK